MRKVGKKKEIRRNKIKQQEQSSVCCQDEIIEVISWETMQKTKNKGSGQVWGKDVEVKADKDGSLYEVELILFLKMGRFSRRKD